MDEILKAKHTADINNRTIDKIVLTEYELEQLSREARRMGFPVIDNTVKTVYGINIEGEKND
jgi:hypothetical protein